MLVCICGPTGIGKSAAAIRIAQAVGGVVINADSRQVYRDFPIITAQPSVQEKKLAEHQLYGFAAIEDSMSAGRYAVMAEKAVRANHASGKPSILVGGTGLYLRSFLRGIAEIPAVSPTIHQKWIEQCRQLGSPELHRRLCQVDTRTAARLHPNDKQRIIRALEVYESSGKPLSYWIARQNSLAAQKTWFQNVLMLGIRLPLAELEPRLAMRIDAMLAAGAIQEAEKALAAHPDGRAPGWSGIGCRELHRYLEGAITLEQCRHDWVKATRAYAKRQLTWFHAEPEVRWHAPDACDALVDKAVLFFQATASLPFDVQARS